MNFWNGFKIFFKGILMGVVNVVPISSGTIALVLGVFERFINSIKSLNHKNFKCLFKGDFAEFGRRTDFRFFITILAGIIVGMVVTATFLQRGLKSYEVYIWSFFIGLIIASVINVMKSIDKVSLKNVVILLIGLAVSFRLSIHMNPEPNQNFLYLFLCGIVGATGMVVPGVSGSHLMLLMGNYELIVTDAIPALTKASTFMFGFRILFPFLLGSIISIISFSYLLSWLMKDFRNETLSALSGFMLGSLPVVYPWKEVSLDNTSYVFNLPEFNGEFYIAVLMAVIGALAVFFLSTAARREEKKIARRKERQERRERRHQSFK